MSTIFKVFRKTWLLPLLINLTTFTVTCNGQGLTYEELKDDLEVVLELIADRQLSETELERATREYYALFNNSCDSLCQATMAHNLDMVTQRKSERS